MYEKDSLPEILRWVRERIRRAGKMALEGWTTAIPRVKGRADLVTDVDTAIEHWLRRELELATPDWAVVAEEACTEEMVLDRGRCWVLDPLDGTLNYASRIAFFAVSLALVEGGTPILGIVHDPVRNEVFEAVRGSGSQLDGVATSATPDLETVSMIAMSSGLLDELASVCEGRYLRRLMRDFPKVRNFGAQSLQLCWVGCGRLAATASVEARVWDDLAGALFAAEAGALYTGLDGLPVFPVRSTDQRLRTLAANPRDHEQILAILSYGSQPPEEGL